MTVRECAVCVCVCTTQIASVVVSLLVTQDLGVVVTEVLPMEQHFKGEKIQNQSYYTTVFNRIMPLICTGEETHNRLLYTFTTVCTAMCKCIFE